MNNTATIKISEIFEGNYIGRTREDIYNKIFKAYEDIKKNSQGNINKILLDFEGVDYVSWCFADGFLVVKEKFKSFGVDVEFINVNFLELKKFFEIIEKVKKNPEKYKPKPAPEIKCIYLEP